MSYSDTIYQRVAHNADPLRSRAGSSDPSARRTG